MDDRLPGFLAFRIGVQNEFGWSHWRTECESYELQSELERAMKYNFNAVKVIPYVIKYFDGPSPVTYKLPEMIFRRSRTDEYVWSVVK
jgi:hypothetical protein